MPAAAFPCPTCRTPLVIEPGTAEVATSCPHCTGWIEGYFFPAMFRPMQTGAQAAALVDQTETSCFYHPQKVAQRVCDGCGRLICALCSIELGAEHLCPNCLASGRKKGKITTLEDSRTRYDNIALGVAFLGVVMYTFSIFIEPAAIYISIRHWNSPSSLLGARKWRFVVAILLACGVLVVWSIFVFELINGLSHAPHPTK